MNLVIVESPAKAKTINKYLGDDYKVLASYGHIRDLPSKNGSVDTENNFNMTWEIDPGSKKPLKEIYDAAKDCEKIILATDPRAIVISPTAATIRYLGPLLDYGNVAILEPENGLLFVFAGMGTLYGEIGQVIPALSPIGLMPRQVADIDKIFKTGANIYSGKLSETLYVEVRSGSASENPLDWFK